MGSGREPVSPPILEAYGAQAIYSTDVHREWIDQDTICISFCLTIKGERRCVQQILMHRQNWLREVFANRAFAAGAEASVMLMS